MNSAIEAAAAILWSEDLGNGQEFGTLAVRNPNHCHHHPGFVYQHARFSPTGCWVYPYLAL